MRSRSQRFVAAVSVLLAPAVFGAAVEEHALKARFEPGKTVYFEQVERVDQKFDMGQGEPMVMKMESLYCLKQVSQPASEGRAKLVFSYDRLAMSVDSAMLPPMKYDSDKKNDEDEAEQLEMVFKPMIGESLTVEVGPNARALSGSGMAAIVEKVEKEASGNMFWSQMKESLTDDSFKAQMVDRQTALLPEKPVKVGDTWTGSLRVDSGPIGTMVIDYSCKLKSVDKEDGRKIAVIDYAAKMSMAPDSKPTGQAAQMNIKLDSGGGKGTARFDVESGTFVKIEGDNAMDMSMDVNGTKMGMKQKMNSTLRWLTEKDRDEQRKANKAADKASEKAADKAGEKSEDKNDK